MKDFELRLFERLTTTEQGKEEAAGQYARVLQYRKLMPVHSTNSLDLEWRWTDWTDVPVVSFQERLNV